MKRQVDAWLGGQSLRSLDPKILVTDIREESPEVSAETANLAGRSGSYLQDAARRRSKTVVVEFAIRELYDLEERARVLDAVNAWAQDGFLTVSFRPDMRLRAKVTQRAVMASARDYTERMTITFKAFYPPCWEDVRPTYSEEFASSGGIFVRGSATTVLDIEIEAADAVSGVRVSTDEGREMRFAGLEIPALSKLVITHDDAGVLLAQVGGVSVLPYRTAASDDDLVVSPGTREITVETDSGMTLCVASARGRWL